MKQTSGPAKKPAEAVVKDIRRATRRQFSAEDKIRFVLEGLRGWKLCATMRADDVTDTLALAPAAAGLDQVQVVHRPRLLTDNGSSYIAGDPAEWLAGRGMAHIRGAPRHPQTQGKIERWHLTLKNRILLEHYYLPGALEEQVSAFVEHYNRQRYHESLSNRTPADVYFGRGAAILLERDRIKRQTHSRFDAEVFQKVRRHRRRFCSIYLTNLLAACYRRGHQRWVPVIDAALVGLSSMPLRDVIPTRVKGDSFRGFQSGASQPLWRRTEVRHAARDCPSSGL